MAKRILFVDDEPWYVRPQCLALQEAGYEVQLVTGPDEALDALRLMVFDLIILDSIMPPSEHDVQQGPWGSDDVETGVRLHERIRGEPRTAELPVLFLTVVRDPEIRRKLEKQEGRHKRQVHILTKPVPSSTVVAEVQRLLGDYPDQHRL